MIDGVTDIKFLVEEEEELEAVAEEEDGDDGDEQVGQVLLPPLGSRAWGPERHTFKNKLLKNIYMR